jgi:hypothetical protein
LRGERSIDLFTWRARTGGRVLAWVSGAQARLSLPASGRFRKYILEGLRIGIVVLSRLVYHA